MEYVLNEKMKQELQGTKYEYLTNKPIKTYTAEELQIAYLGITTEDGSCLSSSAVKAIDAKLSTFGTLENVDNGYKGKETESLSIGTALHKACETEGESLKDLVADQPELLDELTAKQKNVVFSDKPAYQAYIDEYNNAESRKFKKIMEIPEPFQNDKEKNAVKKVMDEIDSWITKGRQYIDFKENNKDKDIIPQESYDIIKSSFASVERNQRMKELLFDSYLPPTSIESGIVETFNEIVILWEFPVSLVENVVLDDEGTSDTPVVTAKIPCKSMIDRLIIDHSSKTIKLIDIKTSIEHPNSFPRAYKKYGYYRQLAFYTEALMHWLSGKDILKAYTPNVEYIKDREIDFNEYNLEQYIAYIGTKYPVSKVFSISGVDLESSIVGGTLKPTGTLFNEEGELQIFLNREQKKNLVKLGLINNSNPDLDVRGYYEIIGKYEQYRQKWTDEVTTFLNGE